jgi:hypothetical protein
MGMSLASPHSPWACRSPLPTRSSAFGVYRDDETHWALISVMPRTVRGLRNPITQPILSSRAPQLLKEQSQAAPPPHSHPPPPLLKHSHSCAFVVVPGRALPPGPSTPPPLLTLFPGRALPAGPDGIRRRRASTEASAAQAEERVDVVRRRGPGPARAPVRRGKGAPVMR